MTKENWMVVLATVAMMTGVGALLTSVRRLNAQQTNPPITDNIVTLRKGPRVNDYGVPPVLHVIADPIRKTVCYVVTQEDSPITVGISCVKQ
jgi:hypothetical protein